MATAYQPKRTGQPLSPQRLHAAVQDWLWETGYGGEPIVKGGEVIVFSAYELVRLLKGDPALARWPLGDLADLGRCYGYRLEPVKYGGLVFRPITEGKR